MTDRHTIVGNVYDKYHTHNPIARRLMSGFLQTIDDAVRQLSPASILEVGCGEGWLADHIVRTVWHPQRFVAVDLTPDHLAPDLDPHIQFQTASVYELRFRDDEFDLVLCCEVLEHLDRPALAIPELGRIARTAVIVSTPREPLWRLLNFARGKYLRDFGNTPGHIQHFSRRSLVRLVGRFLDVQDVHTPLPWTVIRAAPRPLSHSEQ
jgi:SAM-dependent methyltransferase